MSRYTAALLAALGALSLCACSSKTDVSEKNFGAALTQYFEKKGELCIGTWNWPVDVSAMDMRLQSGTVSQMAALEGVGLVKGEDTEVQATNIYGKPTGINVTVKRYTLTDAAKPYLREKDAEMGLNGKTTVKQTSICWGKKALDKVVKWEGPMKLGDYQEAGVTYTYKIDNLADWAKQPQVQTAFRAVKTTIEGAGAKESKHGVKLTSQGWEARGLD